MNIRTCALALALGLAATLAAANCKDIAKGCHDNLLRDLAACDRNYSGEQHSACTKRANKQWEYCNKAGGGCP